jgi:hypothetical protein
MVRGKVMLDLKKRSAESGWRHWNAFRAEAGLSCYLLMA